MTVISGTAVQPALATFVVGMRSASNRFDGAAARIAQDGPDAEATVDTITSSIEMQACATGVRTASDMEGSLIDVLA